MPIARRYTAVPTLVPWRLFLADLAKGLAKNSQYEEVVHFIIYFFSLKITRSIIIPNYHPVMQISYLLNC